MMLNPQSVVAAVEAHEAWFAAHVLAALDDSYQAEPVREEELAESH